MKFQNIFAIFQKRINLLYNNTIIANIADICRISLHLRRNRTEKIRNPKIRNQPIPTPGHKYRSGLLLGDGLLLGETTDHPLHPRVLDLGGTYWPGRPVRGGRVKPDHSHHTYLPIFRENSEVRIHFIYFTRIREIMTSSRKFRVKFRKIFIEPGAKNKVENDEFD